MLNDLLKRLGGSKPDRRAASRIRKRYEMAWEREGTLVPAIGLEISEKGLLFGSREVPGSERVDVLLDVNRRRIRARVKIARQKGYEGDPCPECGQLTLVRSGACAKCDTCGATSGCS